MKEIILDPFNLSCIFLSLCMYSLIIYPHARRYAPFLDKPLTGFIFAGLTPISVFSFNYVRPELLSNFIGERNIASIALQLSIYGAIFLTFKDTWFRGFLRNSLSIIQDPALASLLGLVMLSSLWSETPLLTLRSGLVVLIISGLAAHVGSRYSWKELSRIIRWTLAIITVSSFAFCLAFPSIGTTGKGWSGIISGANFLGVLSGLSAALWFSHVLKSHNMKLVSIFLTSINVFLVSRTNSSTSLVVLIALLPLGSALRFFRKLEPKPALALLTIYLSGLIFLITYISDNFSSIIESFGKGSSASGRGNFWPQIIERIQEKPFLGYGYAGFWQPWRGEENPSAGIIINTTELTSHAHNGLLEIGVYLGILGVILFLLSFLINSFLLLKNFYRQDIDFETIFIFFMYLIVVNSAMSQLLEPRYIWFLYVALTTRLRKDIFNRGLSHFDQFKASLDSKNPYLNPKF